MMVGGGGDWVKISATMIGWRRKKTLAKTAQSSPQKTKFGLFKKPRKMPVLPYVPVGIIRVFFNFRFFNRNSQSQKKLAKKITYFTISFRSKNFTYFKKFNSLDIEKNIAKQTQHNQIPFWLYKFYGKQVSGWCQKKTFGLHQFLDAQELHSRSTMKANVCVFLYISVRTF